MNATSKGVSLGIYGPEANKIEVGPSQPFVELLGRKVGARPEKDLLSFGDADSRGGWQVPVLSTQNGEWRAISKGHVADPDKAFAYMRGAFRQQLGAVVGTFGSVSRLARSGLELTLGDPQVRCGFSLPVFRSTRSTPK